MRVGTIVVGYDGSPDACAALDAAIDHVGTGGTLHVVTSIDERTLADVDRMLRDTPPDLRRPRVHPEGVLHRFHDDARLLVASRGIAHAAHLLDDPPGRSSSGSPGSGPATSLLALADRLGADLIAVGCHGLGNDRSFARGSVAHRVAHHATTSVLIVRHHDSLVRGAAGPQHQV